MKEMITGPASVDSIRALTYKYKAVIDPFIQADSNKFAPYDDFINNIDSNLITMDGPKKTVIPGVLPTVMGRAETVMAQIEEVLPVLEQPQSQRVYNGPTLRYFHDVQRHNLAIQYFVSDEKNTISMTIFSLDGTRKLAVNEGIKSHGYHTANVSIQALSPGMYLISFIRGAQTTTRTIMVVR
jgi:hypothetical protein